MTVFAGIELPDRQNIDLPDLATARALQAAVDAGVGLPREGMLPIGYPLLNRVGSTTTQAGLEANDDGTVRYLAFENGATLAYLRQLWADFNSFENGPIRGLTQTYESRRADHYFDRAGRALRESLHDLSPVLARDAIHVMALERVGDCSLRTLSGAAPPHYGYEVRSKHATVHETLTALSSDSKLRLLPTPFWWRTPVCEAAVVFVARQSMWERLPSLKPRASIAGLPRSLPEAVTFLIAAELAWRDGLHWEPDSFRSIIGRAARLLLAVATRQPNREPPQFQLFDALSELAKTRYERRATRAWLAFVPSDSETCIARLEKSVHITEHRMVRKILEAAGRDDVVLTDGEQVFGITSARDSRTVGSGVVRFGADGSWDFYEQVPHKRLAPIFRVQQGVPTLASSGPVDRAALSRAWELLPAVHASTRQQVFEICVAATEHGHGALIVLSDHAADEALRLGSQTLRIHPTPITRLLAQLTQVDGALIVDCAGACHAFGAILDGVASIDDVGDPSRGSRYNSALRYIDSQRARHRSAVAIVVSEDGMVDVLPRAERS